MATSTDPHLGAIRLAWWRERLEELGRGEKAPAEPRLQAVAHELLPRGVTGSELSKLEDAWLPMLEPFPWSEDQTEGFKLRGKILFGIGARLLGCADADGEAPGAFWSLIDGADHCSDSQSRELLRRAAGAQLAEFRGRSPRALRPLTVLAALAAADLLRKGSGFGRLSAAVRHRLMGDLPRS